MGTKTGEEIIADAAGLYNDNDFDRIDEEPGGDNVNNWLDFLNYGQSQLVIYRPQANIVNTVWQLIEGTRQRIPDGSASYLDPASATLAEGIQLIRIIRNMGSDGLTHGNAITIIDMDALDDTIPGWHSESGVATVLNYMYDERDPFHFWVTPPQPSSSMGWIEAQVSSVPDELAAKANTLTLSDIYYHCLLDYMLYRAYLIDADNSPIAAQKAMNHFNLFVAAIGRKDLVVRALSPNVPRPQSKKVE